MNLTKKDSDCKHHLLVNFKDGSICYECGKREDKHEFYKRLRK